MNFIKLKKLRLLDRYGVSARYLRVSAAMGWRKGHVHTTHQVSQDYPKQGMVGCVRTTGNRRGGILHRTLLIATHDVIDSPQEPPNQCLPSSGLDFLWHGSIRSAVLRSPSLSRDANRRDYLVARTNWISDRNGMYLLFLFLKKKEIKHSHPLARVKF